MQTADSAAPVVRQTLRLQRTHQPFLLRELSFVQQFSHVYYERLRALKPRAEERMGLALAAKGAKPAPVVRVLNLHPGCRATIAGVAFKQMGNFRGFLAEYTKELVRLEAGDDEGDGDADDALGIDEEAAVGAIDAASGAGCGGPAAGWCAVGDAVLLEDESGRVELVVDAADPDAPVPARFVTGVVFAVTGVLQAKGKFAVESWCYCGASPQVPRGVPTPPAPGGAGATGAGPRYVAFVCGTAVGSGGAAPVSLDLLLDYIAGNVPAPGAAAAERIARVVVAGNAIDATDDLRLAEKVRLEHTDHGRLTAARDDRKSAAHSMREFDRVLAQLAETVDADVMPGELDPTNCFWPQQPLHPVMMRQSARLSSVRFVTNPYSFKVGGGGGGSGPGDAEVPETGFFVTSGQNLSDMARQTVGLSTLGMMEMLVDAAHACPTAPNTLSCYPFKGADPFVFAQSPHVLVVANQPAFETSLYATTDAAGAPVVTRLVSLPAFSATGLLVLVDVSSPSLNVSTVRFM